MARREPDGEDAAYEALLREHQELEAEHEKVTKERDKLAKERASLLTLLKDGDVLMRDLDVPPSEWGVARSLLKELAAWIEEE